MAIEAILNENFTFPAAADLSAAQHRGVGLNSSGQAVLASVAGQACIGVLQNKPGSGQAATVAMGGITKVIAGTGGITAGSYVKIDANGAFVNQTAASSTNTIGICVVGAAAAGIGSVRLTTSGLIP